MHLNRRSKSALPSFALLTALTLPLAADAAEPARGPLVDASAVEITIEEKDGGALGVLLPLPGHPQGGEYSWSEAEVSRVRDGESGFCRVRVRRGNQDPARELDLSIKCAHRKDASFDTDLRLETTHNFGRRKKAVVAAFSQPDGSTTTVTVTAR